MNKLRKYLPLMAAALLAGAMLLLVGCEKEKKKTSDDITNIKWRLTKFVDTEDGNTEVVNASKDFLWVIFNSDNSVDGIGCPNQLNGNFEYNFDRIKIEIGPRTFMNDICGFETRICNALNKVNFIKQKNNILLLYFNNNKNYLQFEKINEQ